MKIRKATKKDLNQIINLFMKEYYKEPYNERWDKSLASRRIKGYYNTNCIFWVCEAKDSISGFIIISKGVFWFGERRFVEELIIKEGFQKRGIGKMLMKKVEESFKNKSKKQVYLLSDYKSPAFKFYKKLGYHEKRWRLLEKLL